MYRKLRTSFAALSVVLFLAYIAALFLAEGALSDTLSGFCCLSVALSVGLTSFLNRKYRVPISLIALGPVFWMIGDVFYVICDLGKITDEQLYNITNPLYNMTSYIYVAGLLAFGFVHFTKKDLLRLFVNAFLCTVATVVISVSIFQLVTSSKFVVNTFGFMTYFRMIVAMFIIVFFLVIAANHSDNRLSLYGIFVLDSFFIYGISDIRYTMMEAVGEDPSGLLADAIYLLSMVLLGIAYSTQSVSDVMDAQEVKKQGPQSGKPGVMLAIVFLLFGLWLFVMNALSAYGFLMLVIAGIAYFLLAKVLRTNEINEDIIVQKDEELTEANEKLANASLLDIQTGLKNRRAWNIFREELKAEHKDSRLILYSLDIHMFKMIIDTYGPDAADQILAEVGRRLLSIEEMGITAFRLDGDQFMILCVDEGHEVDSAKFADYLTGVLDRPYEANEKIIRVTFKIGAAMYPDDTPDIDQLMSCAESVRVGLNLNGNMSVCAFFDSSIIPKIQRENLIGNKLQNLDYETALELYYQPQVEAKTGELIGMEALLRWKDEELGFVPPAEFIPIAEKMGIMPAMGEWIVRQAFSQISAWNTTYGKNLKMGINISQKELEEEYFTDTLLYIMKGMNVNPAWIDIEMSESIALHGAVQNSNIIDALKDAGLTVSVDDFGVGYASFKNLLNIRFDRINLSKELVDIMLTHKNGKVIVGGIISLAQGLSLKVNAEGVETKEQLDCLVELGCDHIQGFYFGQPVPAERFEENWLK